MNDQCVFGPANDFLNVFEFEFSHNLRTWKAHDATATCGVFAGNGKILVTGGADGSVRLWDTSANRLGSMTAHQDQVRSLAVLRDGKTTVSVSEDKTVKLWDNEKMILTDHKTPVMCVAVSQDGKLMATGGGDKSDTTPGELILWDLETRKPSKSLAVDKTVWSVAISPDGKWVAASLGNNTVQIFETAGGARRWTIGVMFKGMPFSRPVAFSHDGKFLAVGQGRVPSATEPGSGQVHLYDTSTWKLVSNLLPHGHVISQVAFAPDGRTIASASQDGTIKLTSHLGGVRFAPTTATPVAVRTLPPPLAKPLSADDVRQSLKETGAPQSQGGVTQTVTPETSGISTRVWLALAIAGILFVGLGVAWMRHRRGHGNGKSANVPASTPAKSSANSSSVSFSCPSCGKEMKAKAEFGGRTTRCPRCGTSLPIPSQTTPR
jgi:WD40 repeat protein